MAIVSSDLAEAFPAIPLDPRDAHDLLGAVARRDLADDLAQAARELAARDASIAVLRFDTPAERTPRARHPLAALFARARDPADGFDPEQIVAAGLFLAGWYRHRHADIVGGVEPWAHFLGHGLAAGLAPNPFFDPDWYARTHLGDSGDEPAVLHYVRIGARHALATGPLFDARAYLLANPDVSGEPDALAHFLARGIDDGRQAVPVRIRR